MQATPNSTKHIAVGLSGGVDSALTALLLKQQGYTVSAIFMQNWESQNDDPNCTAEQDLTDARTVCDQLSIPLHIVNFAQEYWDNVFQHCLDEFALGRTPNPDIWCNKEIKFNLLLNYALKIGASTLATGHYATINQTTDQPTGITTYHLGKGLDNNKDQSYFLYTLTQSQLAQSMFPLGEMQKSQVRSLAAKHNLINHDKKDSTGICFIGERKFKQFLQEFILANPGDIQTTEGEVIGKHDGVIFYTLGQRKGLNIGGLSNYSEDPWFVVDKDTSNNILIVGQGDMHPLLYKTYLTCNNCHWIGGSMPSLPLSCSAKIRYRQNEQECMIKYSTKNPTDLEITFTQPQRAITPGQAVVFYLNNECLGGATIC